MTVQLLKNVDPDDVDEVIMDIQESLDIKFRLEDNLPGIRTFGEFCALVHTKLVGENLNDCTTQQAFYKLRKEISRILNSDSSAIKPTSQLEELFPRTGRRGLRRDPRTFNSKEVDTLIRDFFCDGLALDPAVLTPEAQF